MCIKEVCYRSTTLQVNGSVLISSCSGGYGQFYFDRGFFFCVFFFKCVVGEYDDTTTKQASVSEGQSAHTINTSIK